jgi:hypothetical protein
LKQKDINQNRTDWLENLKSHAEACRTLRPIPKRNSLSKSKTAQLQIIKKSLLLLKGSLHKPLLTNDKAPTEDRTCIIFTSDCSGLAAAIEIRNEEGLPLVALYPEEISNFLIHYPDKRYNYHKHLWSYFVEEPDSETARLAKRYPLNSKKHYWLHVRGIMFGQKFGRGSEDLWCWDGNRATLLRKNLRQWIS